MSRIIALTGANRVGKDTMANFFVSQGFRHLKISQPLKDLVKSLFHLEDYQLETDAKDTELVFHGKSPRQLMQWIGTDIFQHSMSSFVPSVGRNFWIEHASHIMQQNPSIPFVISDLRFLHEYEYLRKHFGQRLSVIQIIRPFSSLGTHESDVSYLQVPFSLCYHNEGTKQDMENWVQAILHKKNKIINYIQ